MTLRQDHRLPRRPRSSGSPWRAARPRWPSGSGCRPGPPGRPRWSLNGAPLRNAVVPAGWAGGWAVVSRHWQPGDWLDRDAPDEPDVQPGPRRPRRAGGQLRPGRPQRPASAPATRRRRRRDRRRDDTASPSTASAPPRRAPGAPGHRDQATALPVLDTASVRRTDGEPDDLRGDSRRPAGHPDPGIPRPAQALHRLLANHRNLTAQPAVRSAWARAWSETCAQRSRLRNARGAGLPRRG